MEPLIPTPDATTETRSAQRLVAALAAIGLAFYGALSWGIQQDTPLTVAGLRIEGDYVYTRASLHDRAIHEDRPVVWIIGSSITRQAFDEALIEDALQAAGHPHAVEKFAFPSGTPIFTLGLLDTLDIRQGDVVVTSIAPSNFRTEYLAYAGGFEDYLQHYVPLTDLLQIQELALPQRLEYAAAYLPPRSFWVHRDNYRRGLDRTRAWATGGRRKPRISIRGRNEPFQQGLGREGFEELERAERLVLPDDQVQLEPGQTNFDALPKWLDRVNAKGARAVVVHVPHSPLYSDRFYEGPHTVERFDAHFTAQLDTYWVLPQYPAENYLDYKHPNDLGRPRLSRDLAERLAAELP